MWYAGTLSVGDAWLRNLILVVLRVRVHSSLSTRAASAQWWDTVRDSACVRARSARDISKNMQKYEKLEKIGEGELFAARVAGDRRRPAIRQRHRRHRRSCRPMTRHGSPPSGVRCAAPLLLPFPPIVPRSFCQHNQDRAVPIRCTLLYPLRLAFLLSRHLWHRVQS